MEHKLKGRPPMQISGWIREQPASMAARQDPELNLKKFNHPPQEEHCSGAVDQ
jgi:hypothetical protein